MGRGPSLPPRGQHGRPGRPNRPIQYAGGTSHRGGQTRPYKGVGKQPSKPDSGCCPMVAAVQSARRGQFRLAARYARWSVRLVAARVVVS